MVSDARQKGGRTKAEGRQNGGRVERYMQKKCYRKVKTAHACLNPIRTDYIEQQHDVWR